MPSAPFAARALRPSGGRATFVLLLAGLLGADAAAAEKRRAFATSTAWTGDISNWPGATGATVLDKADSVCRTLAANAATPLPHADTYRAWLSTTTTDAYCHVQGLSGNWSTACNGAQLPGAGPWYLANGTATFTATVDELVEEGEIYRAVTRDENNVILPDDSAVRRYWTGTDVDGTVAQFNCDDWTSDSAGDMGLLGDGRGGAIVWTSSVGGLCDAPRRLLCVEPGASEVTPTTWQPGAIVFLTSETGSGNLSTWPSAGGFFGVTAAYEVCERLAAAAHLPAPGSFVPWLSTPAIDARDRVTTNGPFRRIDGYTVAGNFADLTDGTLDNAMYVYEDGTYLFDPDTKYVWTGSDAGGAVHDATCGLWGDDDDGEFGMSGNAPYGTIADWGAFNTRECDVDQHFYCFSNVITLFWDGFDLTHDAGRWSDAVP